MEDCKLKWLMMKVDGKMHWIMKSTFRKEWVAELLVNNVLAWNQSFALYRTNWHVLLGTTVPVPSQYREQFE